MRFLGWLQIQPLLDFWCNKFQQVKTSLCWEGSCCLSVKKTKETCPNAGQCNEQGSPHRYEALRRQASPKLQSLNPAYICCLWTFTLDGCINLPATIDSPCDSAIQPNCVVSNHHPNHRVWSCLYSWCVLSHIRVVQIMSLCNWILASIQDFDLKRKEQATGISYQAHIGQGELLFVC